MQYNRWWRAALVATLALILSACGAAPADTGVGAEVDSPAVEAAPAQSEAAASGAGDVAAPDDSHEAPILQQAVASGELPALEERLPVNPKVVTPVEEIGQYGGTWHMGLSGGDDDALLYRTIGYEQLMRWSTDWSAVEPNIAESVDVNEEATEFTFHLREGMKWSDGTDFTANDILWWYEHIFSDPAILISTPSFLTVSVDGESVPAVFEMVDDYTFTVSFAAPNGMFLAQLAAPNGDALIPRPAHWLQQFHPDFNDDAGALAEEGGFVDWVALMQDRILSNTAYRFPDRPTLNPWMVTRGYGSSSNQVEAVRNPYYWKVDTEGNQLPYIDRVLFDVAEDVNTLVLKALNGEIDTQSRHIATNDNKALFFDNQEAGDFRLVEQSSAASNSMVLNLNLLHKDPVMRELIQTKDFRIALSHAINRPEIIDVVLVGEGTPMQPGPLPGDPFYNEQLATQYTEYDPELANQLLDEIGLTERDAEGFRLRPDGQPLQIDVEVITVATTDQDILTLIKQHWADVGIRMELKPEDRTLYFERHSANEHMASTWGGEGGAGWDVYINPKNVLPMHENGSRYALPWAYWFNNPNAENAQEPPDVVQEQMELYRQVLTVASDEERAELMKEVLQIAADQFYLLGISTPASGYRIVSNRMHNVPVMVGSWTWPTPGPSNPEQYFFSE